MQGEGCKCKIYLWSENYTWNNISIIIPNKRLLSKFYKIENNRTESYLIQDDNRKLQIIDI